MDVNEMVKHGKDSNSKVEDKCIISSIGGLILPQSSPLASIPLEILLHITSQLTTPEYGNLRLTCKEIEGNLLDAFAREFFTKRQFMFMEFSLQVLVDISKSRFASSLNQVIMGLDQPSTYSPPDIVHLNTTTARPEGLAKRNRQLIDFIKHTTFLNSGTDLEMLTEAFLKLHNLKTVGIRDFNSRSRNRDYPNNTWKSYGSVTYELETGISLSPSNHIGFLGRNSKDAVVFLSHVLLAILRAAGKASSTLENFEPILRHCSLPDHVFHIPKIFEPCVLPVLANLRTLFLDLTSHSYTYLVLVDINDNPTPCPSFFLIKFLSATTRLEHLRLNLRDYHHSQTNDILSWLSQSPVAISNSTTPASPYELPQPVEFKQLQQIDIGMTTVEPKIILDIIRKHRATLHTISLHKVSFIHPDQSDPKERVNLWAKFFGQVAKLELNLKGINMSFLSQQQPGRQHLRDVSFKETWKYYKKNWAGSDTQSGLRDFQNLVTIDRLDYDTANESEDNAEESDDPMDEDVIEDSNNENNDDEDDN